MDREELNEWIRLGPIRITMNSGDTVDIMNRELVMSISGGVRYRFG